MEFLRETLFRFRGLSAGLALALGVLNMSCQSAQQIGGSMRDFYAAGNLTVLVCAQPDLNACEFLQNVNIASGPAKFNTHQLPASIQQNGLLSFSVVCGRPTSVVAYQHCNFRGKIAAFHCVPGQALEVRAGLSAAVGSIGALAFADEASTPETMHTAIPFSTAVEPLHQAISTALDIGSTPGSGGTSGTDCSLLPQCCVTNSSSSPPDNPVEEAFPLATEVYWTEPINVFPELPQFDEIVTRIDECRIPMESERQQLLAVAHHTEIDPNGWPANYRTALYWFFEPQLVSTPGHSGRLHLRLHRFAVVAEDGWIHDSLVSGIGAQMQDAGRAIACQILREIKLQGDLRISGGGEAVLLNNAHLGWSFENPPACNLRSRNFSGRPSPCNDYREVPPVLILHKE